MSSTEESEVSHRLHSITLIAGLEADINNLSRTVDLNVHGGAIIKKNAIVHGNILVGEFLNGNIVGDIFTSNIIATDIIDGITVTGNLMLENEHVLTSNVIHSNTIIGENGILVLNALDTIIMNSPESVVTGNITSINIGASDTVCASIGIFDTLDAKTQNKIDIIQDINLKNPGSTILFGDNVIRIGSNISSINDQHSVIIGGNILLNDVNNIVLGYNSTITGNNSVAIGYNTNSSHSRSVAIGYNAITQQDDEIVLGSSNISRLECQVPLTVVSDARDKKNIVPFNNGLQFLKTLNPVRFNLDPRTNYPDFNSDGSKIDRTPRVGFLAQEIEESQLKENCEFLNIVFKNEKYIIPWDESNTKLEQYHINLDHLHPVYVNAFKECDNIIQIQNTTIKSLEERIATLEYMLS